MLSYAVLGSGSSANAYIISRNGRSIMVDNGFSVREALQRMALAGIDPESLDGLFLTHTHGDHLKGVGALCRRLKIPLFTAEGLALPDSVGKIGKRYELQPGKDYRFSWMECRPFETSHDADKSVGYSFCIDGIRISIITDTGIVSDEMASIAAESRLLFLEANYDEQMLAEGPYPCSCSAAYPPITGIFPISRRPIFSVISRIRERLNRPIFVICLKIIIPRKR